MSIYDINIPERPLVPPEGPEPFGPSCAICGDDLTDEEKCFIVDEESPDMWDRCICESCFRKAVHSLPIPLDDALWESQLLQRRDVPIRYRDN